MGQTEVNLLKNAEMNTEVFFQMKVEKIIAKEWWTGYTGKTDVLDLLKIYSICTIFASHFLSKPNLEQFYLKINKIIFVIWT